jgi:hypothetical protein
MPSTNKYLSSLVDDRLAEIHFRPCPAPLKKALIDAIQGKVEKLVAETLKDCGAVLEIGKKIPQEAWASPSKAPASTSPQSTPGRKA